MPIGILFWVLMLLALIFSLWASWPIGLGWGISLMTFLLFSLLGWKVFGPPIQ